jgi:transcriptional regulator with XRE-family HTH domain
MSDNRVSPEEMERRTKIWKAAGANLRAWRESLGLHQAEIARQVGTSAMNWSSWESGEHFPRPWHAVEVADMLGMPLDFWMRGKIVTTIPPNILAELKARGY